MAAKQGANKIYLHCFLDGRDTPPRSAENSLKRFDQLFERLGKGRIASRWPILRHDRDNNWERVEVAYDLLTQAKSEFQSSSAVAGLQAAYERGENDEFVKATSEQKQQSKKKH